MNGRILRVDRSLELRLLASEHAEELFSLAVENRDHLRCWLRWADTFQLVDVEKFITDSLKSFAEGTAAQWGFWYEGRLGGAGGLDVIDRQAGFAALSYWISKPLEGRGLVTSSCNRILAYVFEDLALNRVEAYCHPENIRSQAVLNGLNFEREDLLEEPPQYLADYDNLLVFALQLD